MQAGTQRQPVQRAALAAGESRSIQEHAGSVDPSRPESVLVVTDRVLLGDALLIADPVVLPGLGRQLLGELLHALEVVGVGEERTMAAATIGVASLYHAVAALAEDARPPRTQPG